MDFREAFQLSEKNDLIYCDPPYFDTQRILYGAQGFSFVNLYEDIRSSKNIGAKVALSIDGSKKSSEELINVGIPDDLFERELIVDCGSSMLRRFQKNGKTMEGENVRDRLLLTW
jgi:DNA adenine methylase